MDDEDGDILNIQLSDTEVDENKADRTGQTEADFQAVKRDYRAKVENGHVSAKPMQRHASDSFTYSPALRSSFADSQTH